MGDRRNNDMEAQDESWTEMEAVQPDVVEVVPIRHGMVLAGRYAIEKIIGRGGSGVVVRAHDRDLNAAVAIKILRVELAGQRVWADRLAREVRLARQIHHPHVCRVFDFEHADGRAFLVMELAAKGTLRDELRTGALAARPVAARIADARAVASALEAIHAAGIVHRDLSPQNLLRMGDDRLVMSDFGLAVDVGDSTSSVHGGTVSYMAPEVLRGGKASFASDIWGLGVVMHELVFGSKPRWSDGASPAMLEPRLRRRLTRDERAVFETCRACTAKDPAHRLVREGEVVRMLAERPRWWRLRRRAAAQRPLLFAGALTVVAALAIGMLRAQHRQPPPPSSEPSRSPLIVPTGEAADWTDVATVLAEVPDRIACTRLLPDQRTIRFVWGTPPRAEDLDTVTRKRVRSPLVPAAYAEGCPDLSPDGKRLVFQGHTPEGRASAFLSEHPDGSDAVPAVPTAEPTMSSEPTWLPDSDSFSYDVDMKHMGVFSIAAGRMKVLPDVMSESFETSFRFVIDDLVFVSTVSDAYEMEIAGISLPALKEELRFRLPEFAIDLRKAGRRLYYSNPASSAPALTDVDVAHGQAHRLGRVRSQFIRYPIFQADGLRFVSIGWTSTVVVRSADGVTGGWTTPDWIGAVAHCGRNLAVANQNGDRFVVDLVDAGGGFLRSLTDGPLDSTPACSPDGRVLYFSRRGKPTGIMRCDETGCRNLGTQSIRALDVSPDGRRLVFLALERRGAVVRVMDSEGNGVRAVTETDTACEPGWASDESIWVSRRHAGKIMWAELEADSGRETGRFVSGSSDCADGRSDPQSPVHPDLRLVHKETSQLRFLGKEHLKWF